MSTNKQTPCKYTNTNKLKVGETIGEEGGGGGRHGSQGQQGRQGGHKDEFMLLSFFVS